MPLRKLTTHQNRTPAQSGKRESDAAEEEEQDAEGASPSKKQKIDKPSAKSKEDEDDEEAAVSERGREEREAEIETGKRYSLGGMGRRHALLIPRAPRALSPSPTHTPHDTHPHTTFAHAQWMESDSEDEAPATKKTLKGQPVPSKCLLIHLDLNV